MSTIHRRPWWRETVAAQLQSGLSVKAYAEQIGVKPDTLYWWKRQLRDEPQSSSSLVRVEVIAPTPLLPTQPTFMQATVGPAELRFGTDVEPAYLGALVAAIARATC